MKRRGEKIVMLTAYDYSMAKIIDSAGIDVVLVGDSASNVMAGHETTLPITLDQMIYHASSVVRAINRARWWWIYPLALIRPIRKRRLIRPSDYEESGAHAVKMEGEKRSVKALNAYSLPVSR